MWRAANGINPQDPRPTGGNPTRNAPGPLETTPRPLYGACHLPASRCENRPADRQDAPHLDAGTTTGSARTNNPDGVRAARPCPADSTPLSSGRRSEVRLKQGPDELAASASHAAPRHGIRFPPRRCGSGRAAVPRRTPLHRKRFRTSVGSVAFLPLCKSGASGARVGNANRGTCTTQLSGGRMTAPRWLLSLVSAGALALVFAAVGVAPAHGASNATVSILHGVPDATVDVYANGKALLENFEPGTLTDPQMSLPAGSYDFVKAATVRRRRDHVGEQRQGAWRSECHRGGTDRERQAHPHPVRQRRLRSAGREGSCDCPAQCRGPGGGREPVANWSSPTSPIPKKSRRRSTPARSRPMLCWLVLTMW